MKKTILLTALLLLLAGPLAADQSKIQGLSPKDTAHVEELCKGSATIFKAMANQYNYRADNDPRYKDKPKIERPHMTSQQAAESVLTVVKAYRNGDERSAEFLKGAVGILKIEAPLETKAAIMEHIAECYLSLGGRTKAE